MVHHLLLFRAATTLLILFLLSPPTTANSIILDVDGNPLVTGSRYYILSVGHGGAGRGGITYASRLEHLCPTYVAQYGFWTDRGRPVSFYPSNTSQTEITEGVDINISFGGGNYCRDQGVWQLTFDETTMVPYVSTNGVIGNPGAETFADWFKIERTSPGNTGYKIVYCFLRPAPASAEKYDNNCMQLDATQPGPESLYWLSLVPIDQRLPFFGFSFKKVDTTSLLVASYQVF